jgi:Peptidase A4 family
MEHPRFSEGELNPSSFFHVRLPAPPPEGFDPLSAENGDLIAYGFPIRPDRVSCPRQHAKWESIVAKRHRFINPKIYSPEGHKDSAFEERNVTGRRWSGALDTDPGTDDHFESVMSSWVAPTASPHKFKDQWVDGKYKCATWVGLDGYGHANKDILLQAGTVSFCEASDNKITSQTAQFFWEWLPDPPQYLDEPELSLGDSVTVIVDGCFPSATLGTSGTDRLQATVSIYNDTTGEYTIFTVGNDDQINNYKGDTAEWIVEAPHETSEWKMPDIGTIRLTDCLAVTVSGNERDLTGATLINCIQDGVTLATASEESERVLVVTVEPDPTEPDSEGSNFSG